MDIEKLLKRDVDRLREYKLDAVYGIPRGGLVLAVMLSHKLDLPLLLSLDEVLLYKKQEKVVLILDEISDSGKTLKMYKQLTQFPSYTLYIREGTETIPEVYGTSIGSKDWLNFPWEA
jgi:hypoxanthine phosphoribosyltransferase